MSDEKLDLTITDKPITYFRKNHPEKLSNLPVSHPCEPQDINGITRFFDTIEIPFQDPEGSITGTLSISRDITKYKQAEESLRDSEEHFRKAFEDAPLGMIMMDMNFQFIKANTVFCEMIGYSEQEMASLTLMDITHPEDVPENELLMDELIVRKIPFCRRETRYVRKNGEIIRGSSTTNTVGDKNDRFLYFFTIFEDITGQKQTQGESTSVTPKLIQANKMEAVGTLAGGIAHEFNNILTTVIGFSSLLQIKMDRIDPRQIYLEKIVSASKRAEQLTKSLLAFSRRQQIDLRPLKVNDIVKDLGTILKQILTSNIELEVALTAEDPSIMADIAQIDQILINFSNNAREAMPNGGVLRIETKIAILGQEFIGIHGYGEPGTYALISVADTGIGMDETTREHIFEPFFTTKGLGKGTGLGLSSVYGTVKQHNGYITVSSEPGQGSTFCVYFPLVDMREQGALASKNVPYLSLINEGKDGEIIPTNNEKKGGGTIIIAEDDPWVRELIVDILEAHGYKAVCASDGEEAIRVFMEHKESVDLIIIDVGMPKKNGIEVYEELRKTDPDIKALFTSGIADDFILSKEIQNGAFEFISKPLSLDEFLNKVNKILDN